MTCHDLLPELRDHAAGSEPTPGLTTHLVACRACEAALQAERRVVEEIDGTLAALGQANPSPAFIARARALSAHPPANRRLLPALRVAAALLVVGVSATLVQRFAWIDTPAPVPSASGSPSPAAGPPPEVSSVEPPPPSAPPPRPARIAAAIVPPGQEALAGRFAALVDSGVVELPPQVLETDPPSLPLQQPRELFVPPLTIAPIEADEAPSEE
jgi:hypothetical protein